VGGAGGGRHLESKNPAVDFSFPSEHGLQKPADIVARASTVSSVPLMGPFTMFFVLTEPSSMTSGAAVAATWRDHGMYADPVKLARFAVNCDVLIATA
jgi:hypothetical protein